MANRKGRKATARRVAASCITAIVERVEAAASIAATAATLMKQGECRRAFQVALEMEQDLHEANYLLQAAAVLQRGRRNSA
jgi:hypothetical protein